jgi:AcrR family transcriptional regulator
MGATLNVSRRKRKSPQRAGPAGKRQQNKELTRERILAGALRLFRKKGFDGTTTKMVSREAGIAEGTLFNYFKTKEDLALYFFHKGSEELVKWFESDRYLRKAPLAEQLFAIVNRQLEYIEPYEDFIGAVFCRSLLPSSALSPLSFETQELRLRYLRFISGILVEAEKRQEIPRVGNLGAYGFGLFYLGIVTYWLQDQSRGKQKTLALLDRALSIGTKILKNGSWEW